MDPADFKYVKILNGQNKNRLRRKDEAGFIFEIFFAIKLFEVFVDDGLSVFEIVGDYKHNGASA